MHIFNQDPLRTPSTPMTNVESFINAIKSNDVSLFASMTTGGSFNANARVGDLKNNTLLMLAAEHGLVEIVAFLLDLGAKIDDRNVFRDSACHIAAREDHAAVVELLVARNADLSLRNRAAETPIIVAINRRNGPLVMLLIEAALAAGTRLDDETFCLAATVSTDIIRRLLFKHKVNLSAVCDSTGRTPLHQAVWRMSDAAVIDMLVEVAGVKVDARDETGCTAALIACYSRNVSPLARLIAAGANLDLADENGDTPLHNNIRCSTEQVTFMLLAAGANVHARNYRGRTPCHVACDDGHEALPALLAFGANLDEPDKNGVTPRELTESLPSSEEIELARRRVLGVQLSLVRVRAFDICVSLQSLGLDALCMCEILLHSCGPVAPFVPFHRWWQIATKVKHWQQ